MLQSIIIKNFKSYREVELPLSPLTMLIGANASGKSNALEAIRFLSWLAQEKKLSSLQYDISDTDKVMRGKVKDLPYSGMKEFSIGCKSKKRWNKLLITLSVKTKDIKITEESITSIEENFPLYRIARIAEPPGDSINVEYNNFARGGKKPQIICTDQLAVFTQLSSSSRFEAGHKKAQKVIPEITGEYQHLLTGILFLEPVPSLMREMSDKDDINLRGNGRNLSAVLNNLCENKNTKEQILGFIKSLPEQNISDIKFDVLKQNVIFSVVETFGGVEKSWDASLISDGTLRVLAVAAAMLSAKEGSLVVIEEIDNGIHPSRANQLMENIQQIAESRNIRVLLTTHNPALVDAIPDEAIGDVVFCYRDPYEGDSRLVRLKDMERYPELIMQDRLGSLMTKGIIDRFAKSKQNYQDILNNTNKWLSRVKEGK